jgi:hypothetical protein
MYVGLHVKYSLFFKHFNVTLIFLTDILNEILNFMKISSVGAGLFSAGGQTY